MIDGLWLMMVAKRKYLPLKLQRDGLIEQHGRVLRVLHRVVARTWLVRVRVWQ
jgi:hypothetical protein